MLACSRCSRGDGRLARPSERSEQLIPEPNAMPDHCRLYYITDRTQFPGAEPQRRSHLLQKIAEAANAGMDYIQLRERDLPARDLEILAREVIDVIRTHSASSAGVPPTRLLINSRADVALAVGADGVHLRSHDISAKEGREIWNRACFAGALAREAETNSVPDVGNENKAAKRPLIAVSCHAVSEIARAQKDGADFAVFAPVFEKQGKTSPEGLATLRQACEYQIPIFALGGVTLQNAPACLDAGAAGIAAIRLFQENDIGHVVEALAGPASS